MTLQGAYTPASIALGVVRVPKPPHMQHVLRKGGSPIDRILVKISMGGDQ